MSKRTNSVNPSYPSGKRFQATNITARGNVVVYELTNARTDAKGNLVLYDGPHGGTLWVEADRVGSTPEEAVKVALARTRDKVRGTRKLLKVFETDRDALVNVLSPYTGKTYPGRGKIVLKSTKVQPTKDQPPKVRA